MSPQQLEQLQTAIVVIAGGTVFDNSAADQSIILDSANTFSGSVTFTTDTGSDVTITDSDVFAIQAAMNDISKT